GGAQGSHAATTLGAEDGFIARYNALLTNNLQATFPGGHATDIVTALAIDPVTGDVFAAGYTSSNDFPGTGLGAQSANPGATSAFVARLDARLQRLVVSTFLGGSTPFVPNTHAYGLLIHPATG